MAGPIITDGNGVDRLWPYAASTNRHVKSLEMSFRAALAAKDVIEGHQASVRGTGRLTERGIVDEVRSFGRGNIVPTLAKGAVAIQRAREAVKHNIRNSRHRPLTRPTLFQRSSGKAFVTASAKCSAARGTNCSRDTSTNSALRCCRPCSRTRCFPGSRKATSWCLTEPRRHRSAVDPCG